MIINKSKNILISLFSKYVDFSFVPFQSYMYTRHDNCIAFEINYSNTVIKDDNVYGGYIKFDKYLRSLSIYHSHYDKADSIVYVMSIPYELCDMIYHLKYDILNIPKYRYETLTNEAKTTIKNMITKQVSFNNFKKYESWTRMSI